MVMMMMMMVIIASFIQEAPNAKIRQNIDMASVDNHNTFSRDIWRIKYGAKEMPHQRLSLVGCPPFPYLPDSRLQSRPCRQFSPLKFSFGFHVLSDQGC
jgi:hypothetical protein